MLPPRINSDLARHTLPILLGTAKGPIEIIMAFVATDDINLIPPYAAASAIRLDSDDEIFGGSGLSGHEIWVLPAIIRARRLIGPIAENVPAGDGGEYISNAELLGILEEVDFTEVLANCRDRIPDQNCTMYQLLTRIIEGNEG